MLGMMDSRPPRTVFAPHGTLRTPERMRAGAEFRAAYDRGRALHGRSVVMFCLRRDDGGRHVGFVTGRKVGGAVLRNRVRRCLREAYRAIRDDLPADLWLVCVARKGAHARGAVELADEMRALLARLDQPDTPRPERREGGGSRGRRSTPRSAPAAGEARA